MMQARKQRRHNLIFYLRVFARDSGEPLGFLGDITTNGLMVVSEKPIATGCEMELEIQDHTAPEQEPIVVKGASIWCDTDVNPDYYATGFELREVPHGAERSIQSLINELGFAH